MPDDIADWLRLAHASVTTTVNLIPLIETCHGAAGFLAALRDDKAMQAALPRRLRANLLSPEQTSVDADRRWLEQDDHGFIRYTDAAYPAQLKEIYKPPLGLFIQGDGGLLEHAQLAVVGSRRPSKYGKDMAARITEQLCRYDLVITSGMAAGIDSCAHRAALSAGKTVAVLGHGFHHLYPAANKSLARQIAEQGVLVTEYPVSYKPLPANFPRRNRIISGLSKGVLVVEAAIKSGSLITARCAVEQAREVFALPGSVNNPLAAGCHKLIQDGAKLVHDVTDITEELAIEPVAEMQHVNRQVSGNDENTLDETEKVLLDNIGCDPISVDELYLITEINIDILTGKLLKLELSGHISARSAGVYSRNYP